jgi:hypothetical protein
MFLSTIQKGQAMSMPDVCLTPAPPAPPVPMPYPNTASMNMALPPSIKVLACGAPAVNKGSKILLTNGDTSGVNGGVVSGSFMQKCEFLLGSIKVSIEGKPAIRLMDQVKSNNGNAFGSVLQPSQIKVDVGG